MWAAGYLRELKRYAPEEISWLRELEAEFPHVAVSMH
jgi:hypothetical protein